MAQYLSDTLPTIHPSAIFDPKADIADDAEIGPGCVIQGPVTIGARTQLIAQVHLSGPVTLGSDNRVFPFACVGLEPQDHKFSGPTAGVRIGDRNVLRESVTIHAATSDERPTTLGDDNYLMTCAHVAHDSAVGNHCVITSGSVLGGHAQVQDNVNIGGLSGVHQYCRVGRFGFLAGQCTVTSDLPPFCLARGHNRLVGINAVGLRRAGVSRPAIDALRTTVKTLYLSGHTRPKALELIEATAEAYDPEAAELVLEFVRFVNGSERGLVPHTRLRKTGG